MLFNQSFIFFHLKGGSNTMSKHKDHFLSKGTQVYIIVSYIYLA